MTEKSPKPHNFWLVQFLHHAKGSKKRSSSTRLALAAQIFFQFFQRHFLQFTRRRKDGNKNEKECGAGWRRGPWQRHPRHSPLPANPAPTQWYVLTRCHGMPATCKMPPARSPHNAQACPKIAHSGMPATYKMPPARPPCNAQEYPTIALTPTRGLMPGVSHMPALHTARRPSDVFGGGWSTHVLPQHRTHLIPH